MVTQTIKKDNNKSLLQNLAAHTIDKRHTITPMRKIQGFLLSRLGQPHISDKIWRYTRTAASGLTAGT